MSAFVVYVGQNLAPTEFFVGPFDTSDAAVDWSTGNRIARWHRVVIAPLVEPVMDDRLAIMLSRPGMAEQVAEKRAQLREADRGEVGRLLNQLERVRAAVRMLYPDEMTPAAKRVLDSILEEGE